MLSQKRRPSTSTLAVLPKRHASSSTIPPQYNPRRTRSFLFDRDNPIVHPELHKLHKVFPSSSEEAPPGVKAWNANPYRPWCPIWPSWLILQWLMTVGLIKSVCSLPQSENACGAIESCPKVRSNSLLSLFPLRIRNDWHTRRLPCRPESSVVPYFTTSRSKLWC